MRETASSAELAAAVTEARERTLSLVADLTDDQIIGPRLDIVNPMLWEIGHLAWFQEYWALRDAGKAPSCRPGADLLYDSTAVPHQVRWDLPLPARVETLAYLVEVRDRLLDRLARRDPTNEEAYFTLLTVFHEDMHGEAFLYTRQTLGYPPPPWLAFYFAPSAHTPLLAGIGSGAPTGPAHEDRNLPPALYTAASARGENLEPGDVLVPGGMFPLGATRDERFVFDNEKWTHPVRVDPFRIAKTAVTQAAFATFVEAAGYLQRDLWDEAGWSWRASQGAERPAYWRRRESAGAGPAASRGWERRDFDRWVPLEPLRPIMHVSWFEAEAYCRWAGRRLPTEAEWEMAASWDPGAHGKRPFPWGETPPAVSRANLDGAAAGCLDVDALPEGDSPSGCRQMIGNVWEWTSSDFAPYPGFVPDPYREYSLPWFQTHKVLRGGCWATRARLIRNTWRNFYAPERRDVWAGFRTCALGM